MRRKKKGREKEVELSVPPISSSFMGRERRVFDLCEERKREKKKEVDAIATCYSLVLRELWGGGGKEGYYRRVKGREM